MSPGKIVISDAEKYFIELSKNYVEYDQEARKEKLKKACVEIAKANNSELIEDEELVFYKSNITGRWWIEIPFLTNGNNKLKRNTLLSCMHEDYLAACEQEIPERWWKAQRRNIA